MRTTKPMETTDDRHVRQLLATRVDGRGLPRAFYHDEALYARELRQIWRHGWIFAGYSCQIPEPGDYVTVAIDTDSLIVTRDDANRVHAFHNLCTHRGTLLCTREAGHARAIICPYHQWTFSLRGELISCTGMQEDLDKQQLGLHRVHVEIMAGMIFVSLDEDPPAFEPARRLMAPFANPRGLERARVASSIDYEIQANWKLVWENNRECYHCTVNHPQYIKSNFDIYEDGHGSPRVQQRLSDAVAQSQVAWQRDGLAISHADGGLAPFPDADSNIWYSASRTVLSEGYASESMDGERVAPLMGTYRDESTGVLRLRMLPNFWNHSSCDHAVTTQLLPAGLRRTRARVTWLVDRDATEGVDYTLDRLMPFWQLTSEQDWALCERVQRGVDSSAYRPGPLSRTREYNLDAFLRWYLRQLA